jgi:hypothetical protein
MRETSYTLDDRLVALSVGLPSKPRDRPGDMLLGMLDQLFVSRTTVYTKPFLVGLAAEALIGAFQRTGDLRIPAALKKAADVLWADAWIEADQSFYYDRSENRWKGEPNLSLLVAPLYAWLWARTGDPAYQERGDKLFAQGVAKAWIARGKEFNQSYRWSFDYVQWRTHPETAFSGPVSFLSGVDTGLHPKVFPNPWRVDRHKSIPMRFERLGQTGNLSIFTLSGHRVKSLNTAGGSVDWNLTNEANQKVASGLYLYLVTDDEGHEARGKLAVVR